MAQKSTAEDTTEPTSKPRKRPPLFREPNAKGDIIFADEVAGINVHFQNHPDATNRNGRVKVPNDYLLTKSNPNDKNPREWEYDPLKTGEKEFEKQFGCGEYYIEPYGVDGGFMSGRNITLIGEKRYQGQPGEPPVVKKQKVDDDDDDEEEETAEDAVLRLEAEAEERDAKFEELLKRVEDRERVPATPPPSTMSQLKETMEVLGAIGGNQSAGQITAQREQWWQEQLATERQQSAHALSALRTSTDNALNSLRAASETNLATQRSDLTGAATAASIRYEAMLAKARDDASAVAAGLNAEISRVRDDARKEKEEERTARLAELVRRDTAADQTIGTLRASIQTLESRMSAMRSDADTKISMLTGDGTTHLLGKLQSELLLNFERQQLATLNKRADEAEKERDTLRKEKYEMLDTISHMKQERPTRDALAAAAEEVGGLHIPPIFMKIITPLIPVAGMLAIQYFMRKKEEMPPEVQDFFNKWKQATEGKVDPEVWAAQQEQARQEAEHAAAEEAAAQEEVRQTKQRSRDYEEEQARIKAESERRVRQQAQEEDSKRRDEELRTALRDRAREFEAAAVAEAEAAKRPILVETPILVDSSWKPVVPVVSTVQGDQPVVSSTSADAE